MLEDIVPEVKIEKLLLRPWNPLAVSDISLNFIVHAMGRILRDGGKDLHGRGAVFPDG
jgi:hypothetical protein